MKTILKKFRGKRIRLYTVSGVESYLGVLEDIKDDYITLKDSMHGESAHIAIQYIESFHEAPASKE